MKDCIHFVHGNGFPSGCYRQLLTPLQSYFDIRVIDRVGHTSEFPVTDNWHYLVDEVIHSVRTQSRTPVIAVGHSLGGILSWLAAVLEPTLFTAVILLDSPLIGPVRSNMIRLSKKLGIIDHVTPAYRVKGRRKHWHNKEEVLAYLKSRPLFKFFTEECLYDYIDYGMDQSDIGYSLRFDTHIEYQIYRTIPHILHEYEGKSCRPTALIYGDNSNVVNMLDVWYMQNNHDVKAYKTKGTHMFPMEHPLSAAGLLMQVIDEIRCHS